MEEGSDNSYFWPAYVDFMTVLFFIALGIGGLMYLQYAHELKGLKKYQHMVDQTISVYDRLKIEFRRQNVRLDTSIKDKIKLEGDFLFGIDEDFLKDSNAIAHVLKIGESIRRVLDVDSNKYKYTIRIDGHTDSVFTETHNNDLSFHRAVSIANIWSSELGLQLPLYEIIPGGYGELMPVDDNGTSEGRGRNRRIEISIIPKMSELIKLIQQREDSK